MKRLMDIALSATLLPLALPLCLILMLMIRLDSAGAPLFVQTRVGRGQRPFQLFKLRTMASGTEHAASHLVSVSRITRIGNLLRRLKLDELPQLWNVLNGTMSLVGPRPCLPVQHELVAERAARGLFDIRPGVTGPAQVAGIDMADPARLATVEAAYFHHASLGGDIRLLWQTVMGAGRGDAVSAGQSIRRDAK